MHNKSLILFLYIAKNYIKSFCAVLIILFTIVAFIEGVDGMRRIADMQCGFLYFLFFIILKSIVTISSFFPFITFLATIVCLLLLNNKLELIVIRCLGISIMKIVYYISICAICIGAFYITVFNYSTTYAIREIKNMRKKILPKQQKDDEFAITKTGVWFRDTNTKYNMIIHANSLDIKNKTLNGIDILLLSKAFSVKYLIHANYSSIEDGEWLLSNVVISMPNNSVQNLELLKIPTSLTFDKINSMLMEPNTIFLWRIKKYIAILDRIGLSTIRYKVQLFSQLSSIIQILAFVMLAAFFCIIRIPRDNKYYVRVCIAIVLAFPVYFINSILTAYGINESISVINATFTFPICLFTLFLFLLYKKACT